jgi:preprotein translocase subunit SecE
MVMIMTAILAFFFLGTDAAFSEAVQFLLKQLG